MRKKRYIIIAAMTITLLLNACSKEEDNRIDKRADSPDLLQETAEENVSQSDAMDKEVYDGYYGEWSLNGRGYQDVLKNGGAFLNCNITDGNIFDGSIYTQQGAAERFAEIEISGVIENNRLIYYFEDDGWGGSGTLQLDFEEDKITATVIDYVMDEKNTSGYGISGTYEFTRSREDSEIAAAEEQAAEDLPLDINERSKYYQSSAYYEEVMDYWENVREVRDISNVLEPLYETDKKLYTENDFENVPELIIHLAKNEIYARHGYVFRDADLQNYFYGCVWYRPMEDGKQFDDSVFNEIEKQNLKILSALDTYCE